MKYLMTFFVAVSICFGAAAQNDETVVPDGLPLVIEVGGQKQHVQGIAVDTLRRCAYFSFTSRFIKTDLEGNITASIDRIPGHLGDLSFDAGRNIIYASLEKKDDQIGKGIAKVLDIDVVGRENVSFSIAIIDLSRLTRLSMDYMDEGLMKFFSVEDAVKDYKAVVCDSLEHRFGCSGIDGVAVGPAPGKTACRYNSLYVAYGIYGDTKRTDNDYQVVLRYDISKGWPKFRNRYFVHTGNTTYGVQNLEFDPSSGYMFMAVYKGRKSNWPNYSLFAVDLTEKPYRSFLEGVPYFTDRASVLHLASDNGFENLGGNASTPVPSGWHFKWGSTGFFPLGNGYYYISEEYKKDGLHGCRAVLYRWDDAQGAPFVRLME